MAGLREGRDFFISYTGVNQAWAEWIAVTLERAGYTTLLQAWDFEPGSDFVHQMQQATVCTARTIAVLSPAYFGSQLGEAEWRSAFAEDPTGERGRLVPVRVQPCTPPGLLASRVYIDLVDLDETTARQRLLAGIKPRDRPGAAAFPRTTPDAPRRAANPRLAVGVGLPPKPHDPHELPGVLREPTSELLATAYRLQVADIAPSLLRGRDAELGEIKRFCSGDEPYGWWEAEAWAGKTALMAWVALHPPPGVEVVSFFVTGGVAGECDSDAFLEAFCEQLTVLAGRPAGSPVTTATRRGRLLELAAAAADRCRAARQRLLLIVDGLDEDTGPATRKPSIASLLPRRPMPDVRVLVTSRPDRELPLDVPADHPLRSCVPRRIEPSDQARHDEQSARAELAGHVGSSALQEDVLGLITASGGGVSRDDLAELTGSSAFTIAELLRGGFGHSIQARTQRLAGSVGSAGASRGYLFAHDTLRLTAEQEFRSTLVGYRQRLHRWAEGYRDRGWPADTPRYILRDYPRLLAIIGDADRLSALACDRVRHERMLELTGGDALALDETALAQAIGLNRGAPDLRAVAGVALRREELIQRNAFVPVSLPMVWAMLGRFDRAEALARSLPGPVRPSEALASAASAAAAAGCLADAEILLEGIGDPQRRERARAAVATRAARTDLAYAQRLADQLSTRVLRATTTRRIATLRAAAADPGCIAELLVAATDQTLTDLAVALAQAGHATPAEEVTVRIGQRRAGAEARVRIARALAQAGALTSAERVTASIRAPLLNSRALAAIVVAAVSGGNITTAERIITELHETLIHAPDPGAACEVVLDLGAELLRSGRRELVAELSCWADRLLDRVTGHAAWVAGRRAVTRALAEDHAGAVAAVQRLTEPDHRVRTTQEMALLAGSAGEPVRASFLVGSIPSVSERAEAYTALARAAVERGDPKRAVEWAMQVERVARGVGDPSRLAAAADHVVDGLIALGDIDSAARLAWRISEPDRCESARARVAIASVTCGGLARAEDLASGLAPGRRVWLLAHLVERHARGGARAEMLVAAARAQDTLREVNEVFSRVVIQVRLARALAILDAEPEALLHQAVEDAERLVDSGQRVRAFALLTAAAAGHQQSDRSAAFARRVDEVFDHVPDGDQERLHTRVAECLAEAGHRAAAQEHADRIADPGCRVRALCAVAQLAEPAKAAGLLDEAAALMHAVTRTKERSIALARLANSGTSLTLSAGSRADPAWTVWPVAELLAGDCWSRAAPALARLDPDAFRSLQEWVINHLDQTLPDGRADPKNSP